MNTLNQQIAEELGYFVATEETKFLIWIHYCTPDGYNLASWSLPKDPYFWDEYWADFDSRFGSFEDNPLFNSSIPDWKNDLVVAIKLPLNGTWEVGSIADPVLIKAKGKYYAEIANYDKDTYSTSYADIPSEAFCKAWLECATENEITRQIKFEEGYMP